MKLYLKIIPTLFIIISVLGCGTKKTAVPNNEIEVVLPCSGEEYSTTNESFRASAVGESPDQNMAKQKAYMNARQLLASNINSKISVVADNYAKETSLNNVDEIMLQVQSLGRQTVSQSLSGVKEICIKTTKSLSTKEIDGSMVTTEKYKTYLAIEVGSQELLKNLSEKLSNDEVLKVDYNYEKFKQTFYDELEKQN